MGKKAQNSDRVPPATEIAWRDENLVGMHLKHTQLQEHYSGSSYLEANFSWVLIFSEMDIH